MLIVLAGSMARRKTQEEFENELAEKNPSITVLGTYVNGDTSLLCRCKVCGNEWKPRPSNLLHSCGCPACAKRRQTLTHEEFCERLAKVNPGITPIDRYVNSNTPMRCRCDKCGYEWSPVPISLTHAKSGCPRCSKRWRRTEKEFIEELKTVNPTIAVIGNYVNMTTPVDVRCMECGYEWRAQPTELVHGKGCARCAATRRKEPGSNRGKGHERHFSPPRKTTGQFIAEMAKINPAIKVVGEYKKSAVPIECECLRCGHHWKAAPSNLLHGTGCPMCAHPSFRKTQEQYEAELHGVNPDIVVVGTYEGVGKRIDVECKVCGHRWRPNAGSILQGRGCPKCRRAQAARKNMVTDGEFRRRLVAKDVKVTPLEEYKGNQVPLLVRCDVCGNEWRPTPNTLLNGEGCPSCAHGQTSYMEQFIAEALRFALGDDAVVNRDRAAIGSELDIYIPSIGVAVEPGGWHWHADKVSDDEVKRNVAKAAGIRVVTIYDSYPVGEAPPFDADCITAECDLGSGRSWKRLRAITSELLAMLGIGFAPSPDDWKRISSRAHEAARRKTPEQFASELAAISPDIELTSLYLSSGRKVGCRCRTCGHEWSAVANNLLRGAGCPKCGRARGAEKIRKDNAWFLEQMAANNLDVEPLEDYRGQKVKILCRCRRCGHEWRTTPGHLVNGHGCPKCANVENAARQRKSHEQFVSELKAVNPDIEVIGRYAGSSSRLDVRCGRCGHEWKAVANNLLRGTGCPVCGHKSVAKKQTKVNPEMIKRVRDAIADGMTVADACSANGISKATYYRYGKFEN